MQRNTTTVMYENIICLFSFPFITQNVRLGKGNERVKERKRERECMCVCERERENGKKESLHTQKCRRSSMDRFFFVLYFCENGTGSSNYLSFSSFIYFRESRTGPSEGIESIPPCFFTLASLVHLRLFFSCQSQSDVTFISSFQSVFLWSPLISVGYIVFRVHTQNFVIPPPLYVLCVARGNASFYHATHTHLNDTYAGEYRRPVYFWKQVYFVFIFCSSIRLPSSTLPIHFTLGLQVKIIQ